MYFEQDNAGINSEVIRQINSYQFFNNLIYDFKIHTLFNYSVNIEKFLQPFFDGQNITIPITPLQNQKKNIKG